MTHDEARQIIEASFQRIQGRSPSRAETVFCQAVAWLESNYARAPGQHARWASQGLYTWGNLEKVASVCNPPWYPGSDAGNSRCFLLRGSDAEAADDMVRNLTKRHWPVLQAIATEGTPEAVAQAMKVAPAYYEAPVATYAQGLRNAINAITAGAGIPSSPSPFVAVSALPRVATFVVAAGAAVTLATLYSRGQLRLPRLA